jgi:UDP-N-acetylglucosamine 2-epimerase (non-hydrolysing)
LSRPRIAAVFGVRSDSIKMAPLARTLLQHDDSFDTRIIVTGQHHEMLDQVLRVFDLKPHIHLSSMKEGQPLARLVATMLDSLSDIFLSLGFDLVITHGDTATAIAAAQAGYFSRIPVAHVEAGLRTPDIGNPFPEEMNRRLVDRLSAVHFAPTTWNAHNLVREGTDRGQTYVTGQTGIDALHWVIARGSASADEPALEPIFRSGRRILLVTAHRRESWGRPLEQISRALLTLVQRFPDIEVVCAVHLNPTVRTKMHELLGGRERVTLIDAPDFMTFSGIMEKSYLILSDSGGLQEEGPALGKPVLVMRENTERPEAIAAGTIKLVGTDTEVIVGEAARLLSRQSDYLTMARAVNPFGDGRACPRIIEGLKRYFGLTAEPFEPFGGSPELPGTGSGPQ